MSNATITFSLQPIERRSDDVSLDFEYLIMIHKGQRGEYTHTSGIWPFVSLKDSLVTLARGRDVKVVPSLNVRDTDLVTIKVFLDND
jgi:hypothetical protein